MEPGRAGCATGLAAGGVLGFADDRREQSAAANEARAVDAIPVGPQQGGRLVGITVAGVSKAHLRCFTKAQQSNVCPRVGKDPFSASG